MVSQPTSRLRDEADLIERFTQTYRLKFKAMIDRLNGAESPTDFQCVRLCVEAVNMMLASQSQMAASLRELADAPVSKAA